MKRCSCRSSVSDRSAVLFVSYLLFTYRLQEILMVALFVLHWGGDVTPTSAQGMLIKGLLRRLHAPMGSFHSRER